ncbi:unnamed protein product [Rotaria sordida]|uniref:Uncharacterized protein n=1 Tax=Rotaria sordida TaxID=392033 RepID=A0A814Z390_9BILA|nr:unnamed protein product [Rotaria sordida]
MTIQSSLFGLSNHPFGEQHEFEKTRYGCQLLKTILADLSDNHTRPIIDEKELIRHMFDLLSDNTIFWNDVNMTNAYPQYTSDRRNQNSSIHVREPNKEKPVYGTRTSTVILVRRNQSGLFIEKTLTDPPGNPNGWSEQIFEFQLDNINEEPVLKSFLS